MRDMKPFGYTGRILRVDLTSGTVKEETLDQELVDMYIGGSGFGIEYLYREVPPKVAWDDPENRIIIASGPLGGTRVWGSGTFSLATKGPMQNLAITTQANGFLGAYLKFAGYDMIIIQGKSPKWVYLYIDYNKAYLRDASCIIGKDTWDIENAIRQEIRVTQKMSVYGIGPAGEHLVRFAVVAGDKGHVVSKNGTGCVMGSKHLKAIAIPRFKGLLPVFDEALLIQKSKELGQDCKESGALTYKWGTGGAFSNLALGGGLPVRNYTTNIFPEHEQMSGQYLRTHYEYHSVPCWRCGLCHVKHMKVTKGPYKGYKGEEPEYECLAGWGPQIGNTDAGATVMLTNVNDRLGMDANEASWTIGWVMECYEKGLLSREELDGLDMSWGNVEAVKTMLEKISRRDGIGDLLAEGVMRASQQIGGEAAEMGIFVRKGATPRGHDHRAIWTEMLETCVSGTGTLQSGARLVKLPRFGLPPLQNAFSPWEVPTVNATIDGWLTFVDCLGVCRFITLDPQLTLDCYRAVTGHEYTIPDVINIGKRVINQLRVFNFRHGLDPSLETPSARYSSTPVDGPAEGKSIQPYFSFMKRLYFQLNGWDPENGKPLPHTLMALGLEKLIPDLWE